MQIQNNMNTASGGSYQKSPARRSAEYAYEQGQKTQSEGTSSESAGAASSGFPKERQGRPWTEKGVLLSLSGQDTSGGKKMGDTGRKGLTEILRRAWESLGDEKQEASSPAGDSPVKEESARGIYAIQAAVKQFFTVYIPDKWEDAKDRVKALAGAAFQRFGKRNDAFSALSDSKSRFGREREKKKNPDRTGKGAGRARPEILTAEHSDTHLMDSYSKTGEYCRLNENLSRQQRREAIRRAFSEGTSAENAYSQEDVRKRHFSGEEGLDKRL